MVPSTVKLLYRQTKKAQSDVMITDISLGNSGAFNCWIRQMKDAFGDLQNGTVYRSDYYIAGS